LTEITLRDVQSAANTAGHISESSTYQALSTSSKLTAQSHRNSQKSDVDNEREMHNINYDANRTQYSVVSTKRETSFKRERFKHVTLSTIELTLELHPTINTTLPTVYPHRIRCLMIYNNIHSNDDDSR